MNNKETKKLERNICILLGVLFIISLIGTIKTMALFPTTLLLLSLELFTIAYFNKNNKENKNKLIILFTLGICLVVFATFYTVIKTI